MGRRIGSPADRLFVYEQVEANNGQAGHEFCERLREALKLKISDRSLRQWHRDYKQAIRKAKREAKTEAIGIPALLPRSIENDSETMPESTPTDPDLSNLSPSQRQAVQVQRAKANIFDALSSGAARDPRKQLLWAQAAKAALELEQATLDPEILDARDELLELIELLRNDKSVEKTATLKEAIAELNGVYRKVADEDGGYMERYRAMMRDAGVDLDRLRELVRERTMAYEPGSGMTIERLLEMDAQLYEAARIKTPEPIKEVEIEELFLPLTEPEPEPPVPSEAELLAEQELSRQRSQRVAEAQRQRQEAQVKIDEGATPAQLEVRSEIARMMRTPHPRGGTEWSQLGSGAKWKLWEQAGYTDRPTGL